MAGFSAVGDKKIIAELNNYKKVGFHEHINA